jgi:hypothetical protein
MAKFVKFSDAELSTGGPTDQAVFINPEHVRVVRSDYEHGGGTVIQLDRQQVSVREDVASVIKALS